MEGIRSRVLAGMASISDLKAQLAGNRDKYVNQLLQQTLNAFDDVEVLFIGILRDDRMPPRTLAEESRVLDHAEFVLERIAAPLLKAIQDMVAKFGPKILSVG
jgi:hypothetical protein